ncbi:Hypothetical protein, putative [Bodo saltans]|uniref:Uncharacterized protein n=1 Tax=Bodo saltans TaxID=75058 RepID=A0A0S4JJE9_BODSA|nr:Hypothetical protein, putative [Bodo saltans]|eukprot:CUG90694.1 Hypothetical protein, putative [Bodo saltans]
MSDSGPVNEQQDSTSPQPMLGGTVDERKASRDLKLDQLRQQIHDQEELVGAMLAAKQQRIDLVKSLQTLKELARQDGLGASGCVGGSHEQQQQQQQGDEARELQNDVQELLAAVETSMRSQETALRKKQEKSSAEGSNMEQDALIDELLREEEAERRKATRHKKKDAKQRSGNNKKKSAQFPPAAAKNSAKSNQKSVAHDDEYELVLLQQSKEQNLSSDQQHGAIDVTAVFAALETFSIARASSSSPDGVKPSRNATPSWLKDDNDVEANLVANVIGTDAEYVEEIYEEDFEPDIEEGDITVVETQPV